MYLFNFELISDLYPSKEYQLFYNEVFNLLKSFTSNKISLAYIKNLLSDSNNQIMLYCFNEIFDIGNCPSILIYNKDVQNNGDINYFILLICTKFKFRKLGYASLLLNGFIEFIIKNKNNEFKTSIVLSSIEEAVTFYESYGFKWTREQLSDYPCLLEYEKYEDNKEYFILKLSIN